MIDHRIPMMGRSPNVFAALDAGTRAAGNQNALMREYQGQNLFRQYGAQAMQGNPNALAQIAGFDPVMAQGMDINRQENRRADERLGMDRERLQMLRDETARGLAEARDQAEAAREAAEFDRYATAAIRAHAAGDKIAFEKLTAEAIGQPLPFTPEGLAALAAIHEGTKTYASLLPEPTQPGFRDATPAEAAKYGAAAGQFGPDGRFHPINPPRGMSIVSDGAGGFTFTEGAGVGAGSKDPTNPNIGQVYNPGEVSGTIALIDEIYTDPSLPRITGPIQGGGGNDVDELNVVQRLMAGEQGLATIEKINQVASRGWLAARDMLKGGGPITDYESRKAEGAVARMSRAKGPEEFQAALKDFRDAITDGMMKLEKAGQIPPGSTARLPPPPWTQDVAPRRSSANRRGSDQQGAPDFSAMSAEDLLTVDETVLSIEELRAYSQRLDQLAAERRGR